jgi:hypothetical protein
MAGRCELQPAAHAACQGGAAVSCLRFSRLAVVCLAFVVGSCTVPSASTIAITLPATTLAPAQTAGPSPALAAADLSLLAHPAWTGAPRAEVALRQVNVGVETWWSASPDGRWVARGMREDLLPACVTLTTLAVMLADGTVRWTVWDDRQRCDAGISTPRPLHWSQDGSALYFTNQPAPDRCGRAANGSDLYRIDLTTMQVEQILPPLGRSVALSPDERTLVYGTQGERGLVVRDLASGLEQAARSSGRAPGQAVLSGRQTAPPSWLPSPWRLSVRPQLRLLASTWRPWRTRSSSIAIRTGSRPSPGPTRIGCWSGTRADNSGGWTPSVEH